MPLGIVAPVGTNLKYLDTLSVDTEAKIKLGANVLWRTPTLNELGDLVVNANAKKQSTGSKDGWGVPRAVDKDISPKSSKAKEKTLNKENTLKQINELNVPRR